MMVINLHYRRRRRIKQVKIEKGLGPNLDQFVDYSNKQIAPVKSAKENSLKHVKSK